MAENIIKGQQNDLSSLMERAARRSATIPYEGYSRDDGNIPGNLLVVESDDCVYSFAKSDIMDRERVGEDRIRVWVRAGATAFRLGRMRAGETQDALRVEMEHVAPPLSPQTPGAPTPATSSSATGDQMHMQMRMERMERMEHLAPPPSVDMPGAPRNAAAGPAPAAPPALAAPALSLVGASYTGSCAGGDSFANNCAHFLSDAFIRAGYAELASPNPYIHARCYTSAARPIRARDMWAWFQHKAVRTSNALNPYTGWWAVFQLDESAYWGGHVALFDSDRWQYFGTGWYPAWNQYLFQW